MNVAMAGGACSYASSCCGALTERDARTIAALRDTLLPNLISSGLPMSSTKRIVAGVDA